MTLGTSQIDITPKPGAELSGFAARVQPSIGVLDPLLARTLYLVCGKSELLWIHCDLIGFDRSIVQSIRHWAKAELGLNENQILLSATHTHAGPCTIHLREAGEFDPSYVEFLLAQLREGVRRAMAQKEECELVAVEGRLDLAVDRRKMASSHTDPCVAALGFRRPDGNFAAAVVNYAIHPVALGPKNRLISADIFGQAATALASQLPGSPIVLVSNGACANLNPPAENVSFDQSRQWGHQIAAVVGRQLLAAKPQPLTKFNVIRTVVPLPLDVLDADGINRSASLALQNAGALSQWGDKYRRVVEHWRKSLLTGGHKNGNGHHEAELFGIRLNDVIFVGANAEVFSDFTDMLRRNCGRKIYVIGYANGDVGYLPPLAAYAEGGYEVEVAHIFYGSFRPQAGGLELLAAAAAEVVEALTPDGGPDLKTARSRNVPVQRGASASKN